MRSELAVKVILAHSPQAKGKVERANQTLQVNGDIVASFKEKTVKRRGYYAFIAVAHTR